MNMAAKVKQQPNMYVIVEHSDGRPYCYREDEKHHHKAETSRRDQGLKRVDADLLDQDCDIFTSLPEGSYLVLTLASTS